jgi:hypothetical protein
VDVPEDMWAKQTPDSLCSNPLGVYLDVKPCILVDSDSVLESTFIATTHNIVTFRVADALYVNK